MSSMKLSQASLALLIVAVLAVGVVIGSSFPGLGATDPATPSPTPSHEAASPVASGLPAGDVVGEDLPRLPRYPGSVRSEFVVSTDGRHSLTAAEFLADATMDDVRAFYQAVIIDHGWQRADIGFSGGAWSYVLVDGESEALIEIEITAGFVEIDLQISDPIETPSPASTPAPTAPPPPQQPAPSGDDDDDDDDDDDEDSDDDGSDG